MLRDKLEQWTPTVHFQRAVDFHCAAVDSADYFCNAKNQWLRDAFLAARFATYSHARCVRLVPRPAPRPDFEVRFRNGSVMHIEATEVDIPGRRRGDEYRSLKKAGYPLRADPVDRWEERRDAILPGMKAAVERKSTKKYPPNTSLLLYVNLGTYGAWQEDVERRLQTCVPSGVSSFRSIWALWNERLYRCWPNPTIPQGREMRPVEVRLGEWRETKRQIKLYRTLFSNR